MPSLPARSVARHARVARHIGRRLPGAAADRRGRTGRRRRRRAGRPARHDRPPSAAPLPAAPRRDAARRRAHAARPLREEASRRDDPRVQPGRVRVGLRQRSALQRPDSPHLRTNADRVAAAGATACRRRPGVLPLPPRLPSALRLGGGAGLSASARDTPGVESVEQSRYRRTITVDGAHGAIDVSRLEPGAALCLEVRFPDPRALLSIVERVRRVFDLGADPAVIGEHLGADPLLRGPLARHPGIRMPGAWDGFELAVRAILGQQISVRAATTLAGRIASMFGAPCGRAGTARRRRRARGCFRRRPGSRTRRSNGPV